MKVTSNEANRLLTKLNEELKRIRTLERLSSTYTACMNENIDFIRPEYDIHQVLNSKYELMMKIIKLKHAINKFNTTTVLPECNITIDQALIKLPILNTEKAVYETLKNKLAMTRKNGTSWGQSTGTIEYEYSNYEIEDALKIYNVISDEIAHIQNELDRINNTIEFDIDDID